MTLYEHLCTTLLGAVEIRELRECSFVCLREWYVTRDDVALAQRSSLRLAILLGHLALLSHIVPVHASQSLDTQSAPRGRDARDDQGSDMTSVRSIIEDHPEESRGEPANRLSSVPILPWSIFTALSA